MSENSWKSIRNATIASVVAGLILLTVPPIRGGIAKVFSWFWSLLIWCWDKLIASYSLPGWALLMIFFLALVGLLRIIYSIKGESEAPEYALYKEDVIRGAKWRWKWSNNQIDDLWCFCPTCEATLVYDDSSCRTSVVEKNQTDFICENCNRVVTSIEGGNRAYAVGAIKREIDRRIRVGKFKRVIKKMQPA